MSIKAFLFGALRITEDGQVLKLPASVHARSLLAYLLAHKDEPHVRETLAGNLWPEKQETQALRTLSQALWQIRNTIPELIEAERQSIWIKNTSIWVDKDEFQMLANDDTLSPLQQAIELYKGEFLEGFYEDWVFTRREDLRETYLHTLERATRLEKKAGQFSKALAYAKLLVQEDPLREEAHCELMRIYMALEQPHAAMKQFEVCGQILRTKLKAEPSEKTKRVADEISKRASIASMPHQQIVPHPSLQLSNAAFLQNLPLIGREEERRFLLEYVDKIFDGEGWVILVEGEAGVGKTRLIEEIASDIEWRGGQVLNGGGREMELIPPFGPLVEAFRSALSPLRLRQLSQVVEKTWLQVLKPLLPELASLLPDLPPASPLDPDQEQTRLIEAIVRFLKEWGKINPLVLILEDLHWFDRDTVDLLPDLASRVDETNLLIVITYRGEDARTYPPLWEKIQIIDTTGKSKRLPLARLSESETGELIRRYLDIDRETPLFASRLYQETEGNPLFVLETLRVLHDEGLLSRSESGDWSTPWDETTVDYAELPLPPGVERVIARRLDRLNPEMRHTLNAAAILGNHIDFDWLNTITEQEMSTLLRVTGELVRRHFWIETPEEYGFIHDKIRQVAYQTIPIDERTRLHRQAGETLETLYPDRFTSLSFHFFKGQAWKKAAFYSQQAGNQATAIFANQEALALYQRSLESLERLPEQPEPLRSFEVRLGREAVYARIGERDIQSDELKALEVLATQCGENEKETNRYQAEVALRKAQFAEATGDYPGAVAAAQAASHHAQIAKDVKTEAASELEWGIGLWRQGEYKTSQLRLEQALTLAKNANAGRLEADCLRNLGNVRWFLGDYAGAIELYEKTLVVCRRIKDFLGEARTLNNLGVLTEHQGDYDHAREHLEKSIQICGEIGDRRGESNTLANLANIDLEQGDYIRAKSNYELALPIRQIVGDREGEAIVFANLGLVWNRLGDTYKAEKYFKKALNVFQELENGWGAGYVLGFLGLQAHQLGDNESALDFCQQAINAAEEFDIVEHEGQALNFMGHALTRLNRLDEASEAYENALALRIEVGHPHLVAETQASLARLYLVQGNSPKAQEHVEAILSHLKTGSLDGTDEPVRIYLTCYEALKTNHDPRADTLLSEGYKFLQNRANKIEVPAIKKAYFENIAAHRELLAAYQTLQEQKMRIRLPKSDVSTGRPLHPDEWIEVTWTIHASEDLAISGKTAVRQHRLRRLLDEANSQGAAPTIADLASALDVSSATIKRDLANLRASGIQIQTRGSRETSKK